MRIGVIDTNGCFSHNFFIDKKILFDSSRLEQENGLFSHAEYVCAAILKQCPKADIRLISLEKKSGKYLISDLIDAIIKLVDEKVFIINISMGIENRRNEKLETAIEYANQNHVYIISAHSNRSDVISYPASLDSVIGVKASKKAFDDSALFKYDSDSYNIVFPYSYTHFEQLDIPYMVNGNSFLAPTITGIIGQFYQKYSCTEVKKILIQIAELPVNSFIPTGWNKKRLIYISLGKRVKLSQTLDIREKYTIKNIEDFERVELNFDSMMKEKYIMFIQVGNYKNYISGLLKSFICKVGKNFLYIILDEPVFSFYELYVFYEKYKILVYQGGW